MPEIPFGPLAGAQILAAIAILAWIYLLLMRGGFWRARPRLEDTAEAPENGSRAIAEWPSVSAVIPARNEASVIADSIRSILDQDYPGRLAIILVDDRSEDNTEAAARSAATREPERLDVIIGSALPENWTGKMWAVNQGVARAEQHAAPDYLWLTDADIEHGPQELRQLMINARSARRDLVSVMVMLRAKTFWERLLIPAFVFFFQMLYPFPWVNDPHRPTAGAAGGSMLVRRNALKSAGGVEAIANALIDDCALAAILKPRGPIWLGLTRNTRSLRGYDSLCGIWRMVTRSAYTQLRHSPVLLAGSVAGLAVVYLVPPLAVLCGLAGEDPWLAGLGAAGWLLMTFAYLPTVRLYGGGWGRALSLPFACLLYCLMTLDSARRHWLGRGGEWKGRAYGTDTLAGSDSEKHQG